MSRSLSWIDPTLLASAVSRVRAPTSSTPGPATPRFAPTSTPAPLPSSTPTLAPAASGSLAMEPVPPTEPYVPVAHPQAPPDEVPSASGRSVAVCVRKLARWVEAELGPRRWYLSDEEGLALHAAEVSDTQVLGAAMLARALKPLRSVIGKERVDSVTLHLDGGRVLQTLWVQTDCGRIALGLEEPKRIDRPAMLAAASAVQAAFRSGAPGGGRTNS